MFINFKQIIKNLIEIRHTEHCLWCGLPVKQPVKNGRKKLFCNDNHRHYYFKKKKQGKTDDTLEYLNFRGSVLYSTPDDLLHGKLLNIPDLISYEGKTLAELKKNFITAVDDYLTLSSATPPGSPTSAPGSAAQII